MKDYFLLVIITFKKCTASKEKMSDPKRLIDSKAWCPLSFTLEIVSPEWEYKTETQSIKSKNYLKSKTLRELEKLDIDWYIVLTHHAPESKIYTTSAIPKAKIDYIETPYIL